MPFGLRNAGQTFQRFMNEVLAKLPFVFVYLDDILVASKTHQEHLCHLRQIFERLTRYGINIKPSKCVFGVHKLNFLGHQISPDGIRPTGERVDIINNFPVPSTLKQLQRFIGMVNLYHRFVPNFAKILIPLHTFSAKLIRDKIKSLPDWPTDCMESFVEAKLAIAGACELLHPSDDERVSLFLTVDCSNSAMGAVLEQQVNTTVGPLAFFSRKLSAAQVRYSNF